MSSKKNKGNRSKKIRVPIRNNRPMGNPASIILPNEVDVWLLFVDYVTLTAGAGTAVTRRFKPNCSYDVDPTLGSTSTAGFAELAAIFQYYRVTTYRYVFEMVNRETFPLQVIVYNSNTDPGTGPITQYAGNQWCQIGLLSGNAGGPCKHVFRGQHNVADIVGSAEVEHDDNFAALVNTVPVNATWLSVSADSGVAGTFIPNGASVLVKIFMLIRFYERVPKSS